jgi:hypothetical protein
MQTSLLDTLLTGTNLQRCVCFRSAEISASNGSAKVSASWVWSPQGFELVTLRSKLSSGALRREASISTELQNSPQKRFFISRFRPSETP